MVGEALGVMIVLVLCGLLVPIALLLAALALDILFGLWALYRKVHDDLWPKALHVLARGGALETGRITRPA